jgi:hypothetical protein
MAYLNSSLGASKGRLPQFIASYSPKKRKRFEMDECKEELKEFKDDRYGFIHSFKKIRKEKEQLESEVMFFKNAQGNFVPQPIVQGVQPMQLEQPSRNPFDMSNISKSIGNPAYLKQRTEKESLIVENEDSQQDLNEDSHVEDS